MFTKINGINDNVKELVAHFEKEGVEVDKEQVIVWIMDILEDLDKNDIVKVTSHLLKVEHTKENLLEVYSFANERFEEKMSLTR